MIEGQASDFKGATVIALHLPDAKILIADTGYVADRFSALLTLRGIDACIPAQSCRKTDIPFDKATYKQLLRIENMFARIKGWRRTHTRHYRGARAFLSASQSSQPSSTGFH